MSADVAADTAVESCAGPLLELVNVSKSFERDCEVLHSVSFRVFPGDCVVLAGANGSGKTVLMNILAGLEPPSSGRVYMARGTTVGLAFQNVDTQILGETVFEDCAFGPLQWGYSRAEIDARTNSALAAVSLLDRRDHYARALSGGEKRRLTVAGVLALDAKVVILDEPFANLDYPSVRQVVQLIISLKHAGKTLVIITHEVEKILAAATRLCILSKGVISYDGTPQDALDSKIFSCYGLRDPLHCPLTLSDLLWT